MRRRTSAHKHATQDFGDRLKRVDEPHMTHNTLHISSHDACARMLGALADESDPILTHVMDRSRRRDGLLPDRAAIEQGPLAAAGCPSNLFFEGGANDDAYMLALLACEASRLDGAARERELAALSIAILEASSIIYRRRLLVSRTSREADARLAVAASALPPDWARLVHAAMRLPVRASA